MFIACIILIFLKTKYDNNTENFETKDKKKTKNEIVHYISGE